MKHVRHKDRKTVLADLKKVYSSPDCEEAMERLDVFLERYHKIYPKVIDILKDTGDLFTFYAFPKCIQRSIYDEPHRDL